MNGFHLYWIFCLYSYWVIILQLIGDLTWINQEI